MLEGRQGLGGRVHSLDSLLPGKRVEAGGEFIGLNHPTWLAHAKQFGLSLNELPEGEEADSVILINGRRLVGKEVAQLWKVLDQVLQNMNGEARTINCQQPWLSANAKQLDGQSLAQASQGWPGNPLAKQAAMAKIANDTNCLPDQFSYLAMVALIAAGGVEAFWSESENFRCASGNQSLANALAGAVGAGHIQLRSPVAAVDLTGPISKLTLQSGAVLEADAVVLTEPPNTGWPPAAPSKC